MRRLFAILSIMIMPCVIFAHSGVIEIPVTDTLFVVDGQAIATIQSLKADNILSVNILKNESTDHLNLTNKKIEVLVLTISGAIKSYQSYLSSFSKSYKEYLERDTKKENWYSVYSIYYVNGKQVKGDRKQITTMLYNLKMESITSLIMDSSFDACYAPSKTYKIYITTKN